ncbi:MAG: AAA family ATPase [Candidatus Omnitrophica bacterium]|nr:AAA family ATPase [Candidatus Omnitrophota bacterium]
MKIVSLVNQKGGCGKTTSAVNLSYALIQKGCTVLLIDLDPQAHATFSLGVTPQFTTTDLLEMIVNNQEYDLNQFFVERSEGFFVLGASIGLSVMEQTLSNRNDKLEIVSKIFANMEMKFDYCIIDCPPNLGILTLNALMVSNQAIVPIGICELSLKGVDNLKNILEIVSQYRKDSITISYLITQYDKRFKFSQIFMDRVKEEFGTKLFSVKIRTNIHLREAAAMGKTIFEHRKDSRGALDYKRLANEIEHRVENVSMIKVFLKAEKLNDVYLIGEFNKWKKSENYKLKKIDNDKWAINLFLKKGEYRYKFIVDNKWINDPNNALIEDDAFGGKNSILLVS